MELPEKKSVRVYELFPIDKIVQLKYEIQRAVLGDGYKIDNEKTFFSISKTSGWMNFSDQQQLWQSKDSESLAIDPAEAIKTAEKFLENANSKIIAFNLQNKAELPGFFPGKTHRRLTNCFAVKHRNGNWFDHWLCIYEISVPSTGTEQSSAPVYGTAVDVRIGKHNKIIGFSSRWRPYYKTIYADLFTSGEIKRVLTEETSHTHAQETSDGHDTVAATKKKLIYVLDGDGNQQYYLSPYYYEMNGHHLKFSPACKYSLVVSILQEDLKDQTRLIAIVEGGSGDYNYNWAYWNNDSVLRKKTGIVKIGSGSIQEKKVFSKQVWVNVVQLPIGTYNIILNVVDNKTRAFKHMQQLVFSKLIPG